MKHYYKTSIFVYIPIDISALQLKKNLGSYWNVTRRLAIARHEVLVTLFCGVFEQGVKTLVYIYGSHTDGTV